MLKTEMDNTFLYGDRLKEIVDKMTQHFTSDVPPTTRFLVDQYGDSDAIQSDIELCFLILSEVTEDF